MKMNAINTLTATFSWGAEPPQLNMGYQETYRITDIYKEGKRHENLANSEKSPDFALLKSVTRHSF